MANYGAVAKIPKETMLQRIANGELPATIADQLGVDKSAISHYYQADPEYLKARELGMEVRLDQGEQAIEDAGDDLNLARAREIVQRRREWRAETEFKHRWSRATQVTIEIGPQLGEALRRSQERVIPSAVAALPINEAETVVNDGETDGQT